MKNNSKIWYFLLKINWLKKCLFFLFRALYFAASVLESTKDIFDVIFRITSSCVAVGIF